MNEPKKIVIDERRTRPGFGFFVGNRHMGVDSLKGIAGIIVSVTIIGGGIQYMLSFLGRGAEAKIEALDRRTAREDSISHIERTTLFQQASETHRAIQGLTLVVCATVSEKSSTLTRIKCDEALRSSTGNP